MPGTSIFLRPRALLHVFLCFCMPWFLIYAGTSLYAGRFKALYFVYFLLVAAAFFIIGALAGRLAYKKIHFSLPKIIVCIVVLCLVDQGIKSILSI